MKGSRRNHPSAFKAKVALKALSGEQTLNEIAKDNEIHPVQVAKWRKVLLDGAASLFERNGKSGDQQMQAHEDELLRELGRLQMEVAFLKKKLQKCL
jgi:transposase-like protein